METNQFEELKLDEMKSINGGAKWKYQYVNSVRIRILID